MKSKKVIGSVIFFLSVFTCFILGKEVFAEKQNKIQLSYKVIESYNDGKTLIMVVKLRTKNLNTTPAYGAEALVIYTNNISISPDKIYLGNINAGETLVSSDSVNITINISESQEPPQIKTIWQIKYVDAAGISYIEEVLFE